MPSHVPLSLFNGIFQCTRGAEGGISHMNDRHGQMPHKIQWLQGRTEERERKHYSVLASFLSYVLTTELNLEPPGYMNTAIKDYTTNLHSFLLPC